MEMRVYFLTLFFSVFVFSTTRTFAQTSAATTEPTPETIETNSEAKEETTQPTVPAEAPPDAVSTSTPPVSKAPSALKAQVPPTPPPAVTSAPPSAAKAKKPGPPKPRNAYIESRLKRAGLSKKFIAELLSKYETKGFEEVLRLNVLLFLKKSDYHGVQVTDEAVREVRKFTAKYPKSFAKAEKRYKVPANVIASLLWIETRHGQNPGQYHVPSVYLHLLQAPRKSVQEYLLTQTGRYTESRKITPAEKKKIIERTKTKADWALVELRALEKVYRWKWQLDERFRGSFSGAFGIPQFIPSSYIRWARSINLKKQPDLSKPTDAIVSVGHYLKDHGWKNKNEESQIEALMKYNNSRDYALAILKLAQKTNEVEEVEIAQKEIKKETP